MTTEMTTTGITALHEEVRAYGGQTRKRHLDSMGLPQITGMFTSNPMANPPLRYSTNFEWWHTVDDSDLEEPVRASTEDLEARPYYY